MDQSDKKFKLFLALIGCCLIGLVVWAIVSFMNKNNSTATEPPVEEAEPSPVEEETEQPSTTTSLPEAGDTVVDDSNKVGNSIQQGFEDTDLH